MDRDFLAHKLYCERVRELIGDGMCDSEMLEHCWHNRMSPMDAAKSLQSPEQEGPCFAASPWLQRYLTR
ncbi:MAG: hypothetical protein ACTMIA_07315 [Vibrio sp.]